MRSIPCKKIDADRCEVVNTSGLLVNMPKDLKSNLTPSVAGDVLDVENHPGPAVVIRNNMSTAGRSFCSLVSRNRGNLSDFRHADMRALSRNIMRQEHVEFG